MTIDSALPESDTRFQAGLASFMLPAGVVLLLLFLATGSFSGVYSERMASGPLSLLGASLALIVVGSGLYGWSHDASRRGDWLVWSSAGLAALALVGAGVLLAQGLSPDLPAEVNVAVAAMVLSLSSPFLGVCAAAVFTRLSGNRSPGFRAAGATIFSGGSVVLMIAMASVWRALAFG